MIGRRTGVAEIVVRFADRFDADHLTIEERRAARAEIAALVPLLAPQSVALADALKRIGEKLDVAPTAPAVAAPRDARGDTGALKSMFRLLAPMAAAASLAAAPTQLAAASPLYAFSATVSVAINVGDEVINPVTGATEIVVETW